MQPSQGEIDGSIAPLRGVGKAAGGAVWRFDGCLRGPAGVRRDKKVPAPCGAKHAGGEQPRNTTPGHGVVAYQATRRSSFDLRFGLLPQPYSQFPMRMNGAQ